MSAINILLLTIWILVSGGLILHLWIRRRGSIPGKLMWSIVLIFPFFGWFFYAAFYNPPGGSPVKAEGKASGWRPDWPR